MSVTSKTRVTSVYSEIAELVSKREETPSLFCTTCKTILCPRCMEVAHEKDSIVFIGFTDYSLIHFGCLVPDDEE